MCIQYVYLKIDQKEVGLKSLSLGDSVLVFVVYTVDDWVDGRSSRLVCKVFRHVPPPEETGVRAIAPNTDTTT